MQVDFIKIINIHVALKNHLTDLLAKKTVRLLDPVEIKQDYLGKLIYGNDQQLATLPAFEEIRHLHMSFNGIYHEILRLYQTEQHVKANQLLHGRLEIVFRGLKSKTILLSQQYNTAHKLNSSKSTYTGNFQYSDF